MKKISKLILGLSMILSVGAIATSCGGDKQTPEEKVAEASSLLIYDGLDSITADISLYTEIEGVAITYKATDMDGNPSSVMAINEAGDKAIITRPALGSTENGYVMAVLEATLKYKDVEDIKRWGCKVLEGGTQMSVAEYIALPSGSTTVAAVDAIVVSIGSGCAMVADETGVVLVYSSSATSNLKVGDYVLVEGSIGFYQGVPQFSYSSSVPVTVTVLDGTPSFTYTAPTATAWGETEVDAYLQKNAVSDLLGHYVSVQGILKCNDKYYNVNMAGLKNGTGASICYPNDTLKAQLAELDGKMIEITGYTLYISYNSMYVFTDSVKEISISAQEQLDAAVNSLSVESDIYDSFTLKATSTYGATVTWTSNNDAIVIGEKTADGYPATVTASTSDIAVKLTATIKLGELTDTREFNVTVKSSIHYDHAGTEADPYSASDANKKASTLASGATTENYYYIKGIIVDDSSYNVDLSFGNATFNIKDTEASTETFMIFRAKDANGNAFTESTVNFEKGDTVVVYAQITNYYNSTSNTNVYETAANGKIVSVIENSGDSTSKELAIVDSPKVGVAYKFGFFHTNTSVNKMLYMTGEMSGFYYGTTDDVSNAADLYVEEVEDGYHLYVLKNETKSYLTLQYVEKGTDGKEHTNGIFAESSSVVWVWNAEYKTFTTTVTSGEWFIGTNPAKNYQTFSPCAATYIKSNLKAQLWA